MWSSLSAYLYNDDTNQDVAASSSSPPAFAAAVSRPPTKNNTPVSLRTPSPRSSPITAALSGGSKQGSAGKILNGASFDRSDNVAILRGVIVGMKGTGKTSLIRRLRGEDPFQQQRSKSGHQQRSSVDKRKLMALVPWNVPTDTEKINNVVIEQDERVQLYVSESVGFVETQEERSFRKEWSTALQAQRGKEWNFAVWMIDPDMKNMLQYLQLGLDILFPATAAAATSEKTKKQPLVQHMCILLNFRDTQQDGKLSTLSQARKIIDSVRKNTEVWTAQQSTKPPVILVYESSMRDCYGIQQLHSFITLPYLAQKEDKLIRQVKLTQLQQQKLSKTLMESKVADYNDFAAASDNQVVIEEKPDTSKRTADTSKQTVERTKLEEEREMLKKQLRQQQQELDKRYRMHRRKSPVILENQIISDEPRKESRTEIVQETANHNRKLFQSPGKPEAKKVAVPKKEVVENSLESFFSEDESDDEVEALPQINKRFKSTVASSRAQVLDSDDTSSDSDDSDDDFFIDISGTRSTSVFTKKAFSKIEPIISVDSKQRNIEGKGGDANDESASKETNEHDTKKEENSDRILYDAVAASEIIENALEAIRLKNDSGHEDVNSNAKDDKEGNDASKSIKETESEIASVSSTPIHSDAGPEDESSVADYVTEEDDATFASNAKDKKEEVANGSTSNNDDDGMVEMSGDDLVTESKVPAKETNVKGDAATAEVDETAETNDDDAETDSSGTGTDSPVIKNEDATEEEKNALAPRKHDILSSDDSEEDSAPLEQQTLGNDDATEEENTAVASAHHGDVGCDGDEPEKENTTTGTLGEDDVPEEESTAAAINHQNQQTLNGGCETEEDKTASIPTQQQTPDDDVGNESEDDFIVPVAQEQHTRYADDGGDKSEDEFIIPASKEQPSDDESSKKLSADVSDAVRVVENGGIEFNRVQKSGPTESTKVSEIKTNGSSTLTNNNIPTVSNAALAAIEQAKLEAEQMMAQSQPTKPKKEKKKKKDKVKKEKKAKKSKKKEESSQVP